MAFLGVGEVFFDYDIAPKKLRLSLYGLICVLELYILTTERPSLRRFCSSSAQSLATAAQLDVA